MQNRREIPKMAAIKAAEIIIPLLRVVGIILLPSNSKIQDLLLLWNSPLPMMTIYHSKSDHYREGG